MLEKVQLNSRSRTVIQQSQKWIIIKTLVKSNNQEKKVNTRNNNANPKE